MPPLFDIPGRPTKEANAVLAKKVKSVAKSKSVGPVMTKGGGSLLERISTAVALVRKHLGHLRDKFALIQDEDELIAYIDAAIANNEIVIDTETTMLDVLQCKLAGVCLYTPGQKAVYIPISHINYITGDLIENQLEAPVVARQMQRLVDLDIRTEFFNAKFDIRVIRNKLGIYIENPYWDAYIAARLLNENEPVNKLKALHQKYCLDGVGDSMSFDQLFDGIPFNLIPLETALLYAANDPKITYELCHFQMPYLTPGTPECKQQDLEGVASLFRDIEMAVVTTIADMEDTGILFDPVKCAELAVDYHAQLKTNLKQFQVMCEQYEKEIREFQRKSTYKIENPINIDSPKQLAALLYDILKIEPPDKRKPRGTGEDILERMNHPICKCILEYRGMAKLINTYIDKMPSVVNPVTGRIHASFNQMGTDTGRLSSQDPNMQNIPAKNKEIRKIFIATPGYVLMSSDYSGQEPRLTAHMSKDEKMVQAYLEGRDVYVEIASIVYSLPYNECAEFYPDGKKNPKGKERRASAKAIVLGVCYGRTIGSIAESLGIPTKQAQVIYDKIMSSFPRLRGFIDESQQMARELGYVTTVWGRKRRLPDMQLEPYEFIQEGGPTTQDVLDFDFDESLKNIEKDLENSFIDERTTRLLISQMSKCWGAKQRDKVKEMAYEKYGIRIKDNTGKIADAERQTVNSRIQGSAADQTKIAMRLVNKDPILKDLGFRLLLQVHDELIGECPIENAAQAAKQFSNLMVLAAKDLIVPSNCDVDISERWFGEPIELSSLQTLKA